MAPSRNLSAEQLAEIFDVVASTARRWALDGCPADKRASVWKFNEGEVRVWLDATGRTGDIGRPRRMTSEAQEETRIRNKQDKDAWLMRKYRARALDLEARLLDAATVRTEWAKTRATLERHLLAVPARLRSRCDNLPGDEVERMVDAELRRALDAAANEMEHAAETGPQQKGTNHASAP